LPHNFGAYSEINRAVDIEKGNAIIIAGIEVKRVPIINGSPPKSSETGSQILLVRNPGPNFVNDSFEPIRRITNIIATNTIMIIADEKVTAEKILSADKQFLRLFIANCFSVKKFWV
jgi:hypothetical protein